MQTRTVFLTLVTVLSAAQAPPRMPIPNNYQDSILTRWLAKPVLESKLLDDAESLDTWKLVNVDQAKGQMTLTTERKVSGAAALRLRCPMVGDAPAAGRYYGTASARRVVAAEDWSPWNRLSFWVYPDLPGVRVISLIVTFRNEGKEPVPDSYGKMGVNHVILKNHEWNHIVWEIANLPRDKVTGLDFSYRMQGHEPGAGDIATFDIDKLELQQVNADHYEGWDVAPGAISFSHSGYQTGSPKSAIASDLRAAQFELVDTRTGRAVLSKKVAEVTSQIGRFQVMDFSEVRDPGTYFVRAGNRSTRPFPIGDDVWKSSLWKAINFFYVERCGYAIPGVHDACHRDWMLKHGEKQLVVNGGWHDAGDLSQSLSNTAEAAYSMFSLAERMQAAHEDPELLNRLLEEAKWGLHWLLKVTFHDGFRPGFSQMDRWTDGVIGNLDDVSARATNNPAQNLAAAATEALAARVLKQSDPILAGYSLKQAQEDWDFAIAGMAGGTRGGVTEISGHAIIAGLELWQATGDRKYADRAIALSKNITGSQQRDFLPGLTTPLTGFFYTAPDKTRILRYQHLSHEEAPTVALVRLCELFPDDPNWMTWYSAVALYTEYFQKPMARFTEPYGMLANSIYKDDEYLQQPEGGRGSTRDAFREQVLNGIKVGEHHYVRLFPVWFEFRGNNGTMLAENKAIAAAAHLRGNLELANLAEKNMEWVVGRNPFVQSLMWGEGYDYAPQYSAMSGDIVGSLPVGIQAHRNADAPYWPTENCHNWKEVWVHPVGRWIWLMRDLAGPAMLEGNSGTPVQLRDISTGRISNIAAGRLHTAVPQGEYELTAGSLKRRITMLPGQSYPVNFDDIEFTFSGEKNASGVVTMHAVVTGTGRHTIALRTDNLPVEPAARDVDLEPGVPQAIEWRARPSSEAPWIAVAIPDHQISRRKEATGR
uniref:Glycoside hydrolase, family 9 n=1 Tax=Solibacter usitatus (strain Ellin6076) TaxID=234267 RepID=Q02CK4_SOLUE